METLTPWNLLVVLTFADNEAVDLFLADYKPYAAWVKANEPGTLMYQLSKSDKEDKPLTYHIIERYADKERDFLQAHRNSPEFQQFRASLKSLQDSSRVSVVGESYSDIN